MLTIILLVGFISLTAIDYKVSVKNNPFYHKSNDFLASGSHYISVKMN